MNQPVKPPQDDVAGPNARHKTTQVMVGNVAVGGGAPIVVQSMTNTDTADVDGTIAQVAALARAGSELVRITVDREEAAAAVPHIRDGLRKRGITTPLIGDFHYIGHKLLAEYPACAVAREAMVQSALLSAARAEELGMAKNRIILSAKVSAVQDLIAVYQVLAQRSDYAIHLGLTEAGMGSKGIVASSAALSILLQQGIGDT